MNKTLRTITLAGILGIGAVGIVGAVAMPAASASPLSGGLLVATLKAPPGLGAPTVTEHSTTPTPATPVTVGGTVFFTIPGAKTTTTSTATVTILDFSFTI